MRGSQYPHPQDLTQGPVIFSEEKMIPEPESEPREQKETVFMGFTEDELEAADLGRDDDE